MFFVFGLWGCKGAPEEEAVVTGWGSDEEGMGTSQSDTSQIVAAWKCTTCNHLQQQRYPTYVCIVCASTFRFSEGQLPHNTVIPDHDERQTSPKMSAVAPPNIPR
jgi:hypothetical protein